MGSISRTTFEAMQVPMEESSPKGQAVPDQAAAPGAQRPLVTKYLQSASEQRVSASFLSSVLFSLSPHLLFSACLSCFSGRTRVMWSEYNGMKSVTVLGANHLPAVWPGAMYDFSEPRFLICKMRIIACASRGYCED